MKPEDMQDVFNTLDDEIIEETDLVRQNPKGHLSFFRKYQSLVAALTIVILLGTMIGGTLLHGMPKPDKNADGSADGNENIDDSGNIGADTESSPSGTLHSGVSLEDFQTYELAQMDFAVKLLQGAAKENDKNILLSPLSVTQALSMTANGAKGDTLSEMEKLLGEELSLNQLNPINQAFLSRKTADQDDMACKLQLANSIWARQDLAVEDDFLDTNQTYYDADVFTEPFSNATKNKINRWVKENTDNKIEKIIEEIDPDTVMYLINALSFDAKWLSPYSESAVYTDSFYPDGNKKAQEAEMMRSEEWEYLDDGNAAGFIKYYENLEYRFVALLPNEGTSLSEYIDSLTGEQLLKTITNAEDTPVKSVLPKFEYEYDLKLNQVLQDMGMKTAFHQQNADFSNLGYSESGNLFIGEVFHKTFISVGEKGTEAGAVTVVAVDTESAAPQQDEPKEVILNRPFLYMILDGETNLPVFIGTVTEL